VGNSVKVLKKIQVENIYSLSLINQVGHLIREGLLMTPNWEVW